MILQDDDVETKYLFRTCHGLIFGEDFLRPTAPFVSFIVFCLYLLLPSCNKLGIKIRVNNALIAIPPTITDAKHKQNDQT